MDTAFPVNGPKESALVRIYICDNFVNQCPHNALFSRTSVLGLPQDRFQITGQCSESDGWCCMPCPMDSTPLVDDRKLPAAFQKP
jgi:hypothetical protein